MTSKTAPVLSTKPGRSERLLAFVLLALVTFAATAEVTHKHGNLFINSSALAATNSVSNSGNTDSALKDSRSLGDCLICQLQQHLSLTLFTSQPQISAPIVQTTRMPAADTSYLSQSSTTQRGRGPPLTSLS